jgi:PAS domain S-box-containing protein
MLSKAIQSFNAGLWTYGLKPLSVAGFFVLVALLWTFPLQHVMAYPFVFLFVAAVIGSSWFGGAIAGTIAMVLSYGVITFFFIPPLYSFSVGPESRTYVAAYLACGLVSVVVITLRKRSETAVRFAKEELEARVQERTAELERSNQEILERERQVRAIAEAIPQHIWAANAAGRIEYCNPQLLDFVGSSNSELQGDGFFSIFHPQDAVEFRESWEAARATFGDFELRARIRGPGNVFRWFLVRGIPQRAADGSVSRWHGIHIDIEDQQQQQERLRRAQENLSRTTRTTSMAEMAASIAHELNQPLAALMTDASACRKWLQTAPLNVEKATAAAERIVRDTTRASAVISRVRSLFSKTNYIRTPTDLNLLIEELVELLKEEAGTRKISLELELESDLPKLCIDPVQIQQVLVNLARNGMDAMQHSLEPRVLTISSRREGVSEVLVSMSDSGPGLSDDVRDRIFEPFFTTKPEGGGMGLAICRSIVEAHDGRLWASSSSGGATFQFALKTHLAREGEPD